MSKPVTLPKYIKNKLKQHEKYINRATSLKYEVEDWLENHGIDTCDEDYFEEVVNECSAVLLLDCDTLEQYLKEHAPSEV